MLHHVFDLFSVWFFLLLAVLFVIEIACTENESPGWGGVFLLVWLGVLALFSDVHPWSWPLEHWFLTILLAILLVVGYVAAGVGWAYLKWMWYVTAYIAGNPTTSDKDYLNPARYENKNRIVTWMTLWPFSLLWWVLKWPRELFSAIFEHLRHIFQGIVDRAFAKAAARLPR